MTEPIPIPKGWRRLSVGEKLELGDRLFVNPWNPSAASSWQRIFKENCGMAIPDGGSPVIRKVKPFPVSAFIFQEEREKDMINRTNLLALLALVQNDSATSEDLLPGVNGEGVFAEALKKADAERREEALKALTGVAKVIQNATASKKADLRAEIRRLREHEKAIQATLNQIDAAALCLGGDKPNPLPLLRVLELASFSDFGISIQEWEKLSAIPKS